MTSPEWSSLLELYQQILGHGVLQYLEKQGGWKRRRGIYSSPVVLWLMMLQRLQGRGCGLSERIRAEFVHFGEQLFKIHDPDGHCGGKTRRLSCGRTGFVETPEKVAERTADVIPHPRDAAIADTTEHGSRLQ